MVLTREAGNMFETPSTSSVSICDASEVVGYVCVDGDDDDDDDPLIEDSNI